MADTTRNFLEELWSVLVLDPSSHKKKNPRKE